MAWILVLHEHKSEVQKSRNHQVLLNSRLDSALHGLVAGALTASLLEGLGKSSPRVMPTGTPWPQSASGSPLDSNWLQQLGLGHPALLAVLGPHSGCCVPSWQSIWGQLEERAVKVLSPDIPTATDGIVHRCVRSCLSTGMQMCLEGMCKAAFGNASCATLQQRHLCITWLCVTQGDVNSKQKGSETHRSSSFAKSRFSVKWTVVQ